MGTEPRFSKQPTNPEITEARGAQAPMSLRHRAPREGHGWFCVAPSPEKPSDAL